MKEEEEGIRETRERVSRQLNWIEISTRMIRIVKNILFYRLFRRSHPIVLIDFYNGTVHRGPFQTSRGRRMVMGDHDLICR